LYDQGFTISGARNKLQELVQHDREKRRIGDELLGEGPHDEDDFEHLMEVDTSDAQTSSFSPLQANNESLLGLRKELAQIRELLSESV
jgi:hypothetical protein